MNLTLEIKTYIDNFYPRYNWIIGFEEPPEDIDDIAFLMEFHNYLRE